MISNSYPLWSEAEYSYPLAFGFIPNIVSYVHEDGGPRPALLIVPGGGYCVVSPTEGEIVALEFYKKGYNTFVLTYTTNILMKEPLKDQPMHDLSRAIRYLRRNADQLHIRPDRLALCGFSAGGHLTGSVAVHYEDIHDVDPALDRISNRPDAVILSYPVITSGEKAHRGSFIALLGHDATPEALTYMSLEYHVKSTTPPAFLWQTATDEAVPVENSYLFAQACKAAGVCFEHHVFAEGVHGLSLANDKWYHCDYGKPYPLDQIQRIVEQGRLGTLDVPADLSHMLDLFHSDTNALQTDMDAIGRKPDPAVALWPVLADNWLKRVLDL